MPHDLSVIVTTWNSERWIGRCLKSLTMPHDLSAEVVIVDNGSTDQTLVIIQHEAPRARLIRFATNQGPAVARNLAIRETTGRYVLTLDHDVELAPNCIRTLVRAADAAGPRVGMWTGTMFRPDRTTLDSTGILLTKTWRVFDRGSGARRLRPKDARAEILGPSACAALYRRSMLEAVREGAMYFDERFFFLWEDVELAWRARASGWSAGYVPEAVCYHVRNGTHLPRRIRQALSFRNRYLFLAKHRLWHPLGRYVWRCGLYEVARWSLVSLTNPSAIRSTAALWRGERSMVARHAF